MRGDYHWKGINTIYIASARTQLQLLVPVKYRECHCFFFFKFVCQNRQFVSITKRKFHGDLLKSILYDSYDYQYIYHERVPQKRNHIFAQLCDILFRKIIKFFCSNVPWQSLFGITCMKIRRRFLDDYAIIMVSAIKKKTNKRLFYNWVELITRSQLHTHGTCLSDFKHSILLRRNDKLQQCLVILSKQCLS